jgi:UDP-glucuronate decarboxylase
VIVIDNMFTGRKKNVAHWIGHPNFMLIVHDVVEPIMLEVRHIYLYVNVDGRTGPLICIQ